MKLSSLSIAILAGGLATRLGPLTKDKPKSLLDVGGRPFLAWQLELLAARGMDNVVLCVGHYAAAIEEWLELNTPAGMSVQTSRDGPVQLGTGGALRAALPLLSDPFMVTYGDSYLRCDYQAVFDVFGSARESAASSAPLGLMTVYENRGRYDTSNVAFREGKLVSYDKTRRSADMQHIDWGLGVLTHEALEAYPANEPFDLASCYQRLVKSNRLIGFEVHERFYEVGSALGIAELETFLAQSNSEGQS